MSSVQGFYEDIGVVCGEDCVICSSVGDSKPVGQCLSVKLSIVMFILLGVLATAYMVAWYILFNTSWVIK